MIYSLGEIARECNISKEGMKAWLKKRPAIPDRRMIQGANKARYFTEEDRVEILRRRDNGKRLY